MREPFATIIAQLSADAERLEAYGVVSEARAVRRCIEVIEAKGQEWELQRLTLDEAAQESGYSYSALEKMIRRGKLENVGRKGSPLVRRGDVPTRSRGVCRSTGRTPEIAEHVLGYDPEPASGRLVRRRTTSHIS